MITKADKGNITIVLGNEWYDNKINKMLDDQETYKHLETNPTVSTTEDINKFVNNLLETKTITKEANFWTVKLHNTPAVRNSEITQRKHCPTTNIFFPDSPTYECSTQEVLACKIKFDVSLVLKKSCLRKCDYSNKLM